MNRRSNVTYGLVTIICLAGGTAAAASDSPNVVAREGGQMAQFQGESIDLSKGWGEAQACIVFSETDVQCFASNEEADAAVGYVHPKSQEGADAVAVAWYCPSGWLCLYQDHWGGGRRLQFSYEQWRDLRDWNFTGNPNGASSWCNSQAAGDSGILQDAAGARLYLNPGNCMNLGGTTWNDRARYVHG